MDLSLTQSLAICVTMICFVWLGARNGVLAFLIFPFFAGVVMLIVGVN